MAPPVAISDQVLVCWVFPRWLVQKHARNSISAPAGRAFDTPISQLLSIGPSETLLWNPQGEQFAFRSASRISSIKYFGMFHLQISLSTHKWRPES